MNLSYALNGMWVEKYRPKKLSEIALAEETREIIEKWKSENEFPNLLLCSRPGMGKTTLAHAIAEEFCCDKYYINVSDEGNVDTIRSKVKDFSMTASFNGRMKVIILDEADGFASIQSQKILRALMEEVSETCRFILTANYRHKIIEPIISRCVELNMSPNKREIMNRCMYILSKEGVKYTKEQGMKLIELIKVLYPDVRSILKYLQNFVHEVTVLDKNGDEKTIKSLDIKNVTVDDALMGELVELIMAGNPIEVRRNVIERELEFGNNYQTLLHSLYLYIIDKDDIDYNIRANWTVYLAEALWRMTSSVDVEITAAACFVKMTQCVSSDK